MMLLEVLMNKQQTDSNITDDMWRKVIQEIYYLSYTCCQSVLVVH